MIELPVVSNDPAGPVAPATVSPGLRHPRRVAGAGLALAVGLGAVLVALAVLAEPKAVPALGVVAVLGGVVALWAVAWTAQRRLRADLVRLAAESRRAAVAHERSAIAEARLRQSEERFRALAGGRQDVERALVDARRRAEAASEAKSRFLAAVSHEFRTPLNGILGLNALLRESELTPDQETYARGVQSSGEALLALVDDMLDFSKIESGRLDLHPEPTDLEALCQEIVELLAGRAYAKAIDLAADIAQLPLLSVDGVRLRQVLINLVGNGVKFTETGGVTLSLHPDTQGGAGRIVFAVTDTGPGIAAEDVERVFGEFEQGDTAIARRHGGAGLGLAISQRIVRRMGGAIEYRTRAGGGADFSFTLDLPAAGDAPGASGDIAGRAVLVVAPPGAEPPVLAAMLT
ncbi:MAG: ATP-binding protein, partial [Bauldia sp.]